MGWRKATHQPNTKTKAMNEENNKLIGTWEAQAIGIASAIVLTAIYSGINFYNSMDFNHFIVGAAIILIIITSVKYKITTTTTNH